MQAGEPSATTNIGVDVDGVPEVERKVWGLLGGVPADHDLARLVGLWRAKLLVNESEGMLFGNRDVMLQIGMNKNVTFGFMVELGVAEEIPVGFRN